MDNKIKIGIPRGLYYYKYNILWKEFFKELGCDIIVSPETNFEILENGKKYSASEMCLSLKIYIGHVFYLKDKVDYVLVPTSKTLDDNNFCPYYLRIYDIVNNTFDMNILNYNINELDKKYEEDEFIKIGEKLGFSKNYILTVYHKAKMEEYKQNKIEYLVQEKKLKRDKIKILVVGNTYNIYDNLLGKDLIDLLNKLNCEVIYINIKNPNIEDNIYKNIIENNENENNYEYLEHILNFKNYLNGILFVSTYPCVSDLIEKSLIQDKLSIPLLHIFINNLEFKDEYSKKVEKFIDMIKDDIHE